jgi:hypothetical protein
MTADLHHPTTPVPTPFSHKETRALYAVRIRLQDDRGALSERERKHLCLLRSLVRSGRLVSGA